MTYPKPNEHGVYLPDVCEVLALPGVGAAKSAAGADLAHILVVQIGPDAWLSSYDYQCCHGRCSGFGGLPGGPSARARHRTRKDAIKAAAMDLRDRSAAILAERERDLRQAAAMEREDKLPSSWWEFAVNAGQEREARALEAWALELLAGVEGQLELFAGATT